MKSETKELQRLQKIGTKFTNKYGDLGVCVDYQDCNHVTVFVREKESTVVTTWDNFKKGRFGKKPVIAIVKPTRKEKEEALRIARVGTTKVNHQGRAMTCIAYEKATNITVRFEDGTIVPAQWRSFEDGRVTHPDDHKRPVSKKKRSKSTKPTLMSRRVGMKNVANNGFLMEIVAAFDRNDITIRFEDGELKNCCSFNAFLNGNIGHPKYRATKETMNLAAARRIELADSLLLQAI